MQIDRDALSRQYRSMADEELLALEPAELTEVARKCYQAEIERRGLHFAAEEDEGGEEVSPETAGDLEHDWMETAECACSFAQAGSSYAEEGDRACDVLRAADVPCQVILEEGTETQQALLKVMVPSALALKATSVLDVEIFNDESEGAWRGHLEHLSDADLRALHPDSVCAGWLDMAARYRRIYLEELERRRA